ncbi:hypothetical protein LXL04_034016 [Taraxacum kok-saghyz]
MVPEIHLHGYTLFAKPTLPSSSGTSTLQPPCTGRRCNRPCTCRRCTCRRCYTATDKEPHYSISFNVDDTILNKKSIYYLIILFDHNNSQQTCQKEVHIYQLKKPNRFMNLWRSSAWFFEAYNHQGTRYMENVRDWMYIPRRLPQFETGVIEFLNASFAKVAKGGQICCPCKLCKNRYWYRRDKVFDHLKGYGFVENYYVWVFHGENPSELGSNIAIDDDGDDGASMHDNIDELLHDRFRGVIEEVNVVREGLNEEAKKFYKLVEEGKQELFLGCKNFTKLSFIIRIFLYKTLHGLSNVAFTELLQLSLEVIPEATLPASFSQEKSIMKDLGLDYKKIPACPNDCMLYWKEHEQAETCHICHTSKWKQPNLKQGSKHVNEDSKKSPKVPVKVVWHFPLKPRLQRLFMCSDTYM